MAFSGQIGDIDFSGLDTTLLSQYMQNNGLSNQVKPGIGAGIGAALSGGITPPDDAMTAWGYTTDANSRVGIGNFVDAFTQRKALDYSNPDDLKRILAMAKTQQDFSPGPSGSGQLGDVNIQFNPYVGQIGMKDGIPIYTSSINTMSSIGPSTDRLQREYNTPYFYAMDRDGKLTLQGGLSSQPNDPQARVIMPTMFSLIGNIAGGAGLGAVGAGVGTMLGEEGYGGANWGDAALKGLLAGVTSYGVGSALSALGGAGSAAGTAAAEGATDATMPALNGLETYTMGGATAAYPTTQPIFSTATGDFLPIANASDAFTNYVVNNGYIGLDSSGMWNGTPTSPDNYVGNFYNTAEYPKFTATEPSSSINYEKLLKDTIKKALSGGGKTKLPTTSTGNAGFGNVSDTSSPLANQITNATYPQAQATQGQVPLEGYSKFDRALTPYNLRKKKKLIEDELYPYIA
jgi:hypothetical protein